MFVLWGYMWNNFLTICNIKRFFPWGRDNIFARIEFLLGYSFHDNDLLVHAITPSVNKCKEGRDNQRLEFLGDSVLGLVIAHYFYLNMPEADEGSLTRIKSYLVNRTALFRIAKKLKLREAVESIRGGSCQKILADMVEALIGAVYLDGGMQAAYQVVIRLWEDDIKKISVSELICPKERLQIYTQSQKKGRPGYRVLNIKGPRHNLVFEVGVCIDGNMVGRGLGYSKKEAEQAAAQEAIDYFMLDSCH